MDQPTLSRKELLTAAAALGAALALPRGAIAQSTTPPATDSISIEDLKSAQKLAGLTFSDAELKELLGDVQDWLKGYESVRKLQVSNATAPAFVFEPLTTRKAKAKPGVSASPTRVRSLQVPTTEEDLAFMTLGELSYLVKSRRITSTQLTDMYLKRLGRYGDKLQAVVTLLEGQARADAQGADEEIQSGRYRGPLHGIPTGVKDLFALRGARTTWGAEPYKNQILDYDSAVVERLRAAGAIICAKLTLGALAMGDKWFGGQTKNPWNTKLGSSGSSAGSASCVSAGLLPFAIGTETLGSIVSPSNQCRVTGLRPSYGRISRHGAMALSWTMDKVGVIARCAEDTALVLAALAGSDPRDRSAVDLPFHYSPKLDFPSLKIGYLKPSDPQGQAPFAPNPELLQILRALGASISPREITPAEDGISAVLEVEAAAAFDDITRSGEINSMKDSAWPEIFRAGRFVSGVELIQAYRARTLLMERFERELGELDVLISDGRGLHTLVITNLTGHPQVLLPWGVDEKGNSRSISLIGRLYEEDRLLAVAHAIQQRSDYHRRRPDLSKL